MRFAIIGLFVMTSAAVAATPQTRPASRPASRPTTPTTRPERAEDPLRTAIATLQKEAQDAANHRVPFPRPDSNFFADKSAAIDPSELLKALSKRIAQDPRVDAYVKWQLLSATPTFAPALTKSAINAYVNAPSVLPLPGLTDQERQRWVQLALQVKTSEAADQLEDQWKAQQQPFLDANEVILTYRDALRQRISPPEDLRGRVLQAQLEDLSQRAAAGLDVDKAYTSWSGEVHAWATLANRAAIADMGNFIQEYMRRQGPTVNDNLVWYPSRKAASWRTRKAQLDEKKLGTLLDQLVAAAQQAPK